MPPGTGRDGAADGAAPTAPEALAREVVLRRLSQRPHSRAELRSALARRRVPDDVAEEVLVRFGELGMVDDAAFAQAWVSSRHRSRRLGGARLASELRRRGVATDEVDAALAGVSADDEAEAARELVRRRVQRLGPAAASDAGLHRRLMAYLLRRGYSGSTASAAITAIRAESGR